jgi:ribosomal protein L37E
MPKPHTVVCGVCGDSTANRKGGICSPCGAIFKRAAEYGPAMKRAMLRERSAGREPQDIHRLAEAALDQFKPKPPPKVVVVKSQSE